MSRAARSCCSSSYPAAATATATVASGLCTTPSRRKGGAQLHFAGMARLCIQRRRWGLLLGSTSLAVPVRGFGCYESTGVLLQPLSHSHDAEGGGSGPANVADGGMYNREAHVAEAEGLLREVFGPQAKLVVHRLTQPPQRRRCSQGQEERKVADADEDEGDEESVAPVSAQAEQGRREATSVNSDADDGYYKVSATFRLLGFPVELAVTKGRNAEATIENCVRQALSSDVEFIRPVGGGAGKNRSRQDRRHLQYQHRHLKPHQMELKAILDELKQLCVDFSFSLKFSIKPPRAAIARRGRAPSHADEAENTGMREEHGDQTDSSSDHAWRCRAYRKDEWSVVARMTLACERLGQTPKEALAACIDAVRNQLKSEVESPEVLLECVHELEAYVAGSGKSVEASYYSERGQSKTASDQQQQGSSSSSGSPTAAVAASPTDEVAALLEPHTYRGLIHLHDRHGNTHTSQSRRQCSPLLALQSVTWQAIRGETPYLSLGNALSGPSAVDALVAGHTTAVTQPLITSTHPRLPTVTPLLVRMRWQFDAMVHRVEQLLRSENNAAAVVGPIAEVVVSGVGGSLHHHQGDAEKVPLGQSGQGGAGADDERHSRSGGAERRKGLPMFFTAAVYGEGTLVWQSTGAGRYRVEFDAYVQALYYMLDQYPDVAAEVVAAAASTSGSALGGGNSLFATATQLSAAVDRHDGFDVLGQHHGKWNCYALLGTMTSQLMGGYYQTAYYHCPPVATSGGEAAVSAAESRGEWRSRLTVSDGYSSSAMPLIERGSLAKGEAWRLACMHALQENFPRQYEDAVRAHPDVDLSADTMARGSKYRALPREKRIEHIGNLFSLVAAFAEEDLGWHQLRIRLRNASGELGLPQWVAEMEALVDDDDDDDVGKSKGTTAGAMDKPPHRRRSAGGNRRVVAVSAPFTQVKHAKRALVYQVAQRYFPKELEVYKALDRGDALDPDTDPTVRRMKLYQPGGTAFTQQLCTLIEAKNPSLSPVSWQLWATPIQGRDVTRGSTSAVTADEEEGAWQEVLDSSGGNSNGSSSSRGHTTAPVRDGNYDTDADSQQQSSVVSVLLNSELFPEHQLQALTKQVQYRARVLGANGDLLIAEHDGAPGESALAVLTAVLKSASHQLAGADGETLWTEFEAHTSPAVTTTRELALHLFNAFLGNGSGAGNGIGTASEAAEEVNASAAAEALDPSSWLSEGSPVSVAVVHLVNEFWFATVTIPRLGNLPVARAVSTTKRGCVKDALVLAARVSFPRMLRYASKHDPGISALAVDVLTEPIVEELPDTIVRAIRSQLRTTNMRREQLLGNASAPATAVTAADSVPPMKLLMQCIRRDYRRPQRGDGASRSRQAGETVVMDVTGELVFVQGKKLVVRQTQLEGGSTHECRLYLQSSVREVRKGDSQLVGFASAMSATHALNAAALVALENLFPEDLARVERGLGPSYRQYWRR